MQQGELEEGVLEAVKAAVQQAMIEQEEKKRSEERKKTIYNTRMLMEGYIEMKQHIKNAISEEEEVEEDSFQIFRGENAYLESIRRSKMKTAMMIANIDRAMKEIKAEQTAKGTLYKYEAFEKHYVDGIAFEEVADSLNCGKNSPSRWSKEIMKRMSVKLFGIDGIEKW